MKSGKWTGMLALACATTLAFSAARATPAPAPDSDISCKLSYEMSGWSIFYKTAEGSGTVTCSNGQSMAVKLRAKGGGISFGKSEIKDGHGSFTGVHDISEVLGHYGNAVAHAGAEDASASAQVLTKGNVSLALTGKGSGWNVGIAFGAFIIER